MIKLRGSRAHEKVVFMVCRPPPLPAHPPRARITTKLHSRRLERRSRLSCPPDVAARPSLTPATFALAQAYDDDPGTNRRQVVLDVVSPAALARVGQEPACAPEVCPRRTAHEGTMPAPACSTRTHACTTRASSTPVRASRSLAAPLAALMPRHLRASGIRAWRSRRRGATRAEAPACDPLCAVVKVTVAVHHACSSAARTPTPWVRFLRMSCVWRASIHQHSAQRACPVCRVVSVSAYSTL